MSSKTDVFDIAKYILRKTGQITTMKLQKLVFYSQAWSLVWDEVPLFSEKIEAWANGPVCPRLYKYHQGKFKISHLDKGDIRKLTTDKKETIDLVVKTYGKLSGYELSVRTHQEAPWKNARMGIAPMERCNEVISHSSMAEYYSSLI